ncbi:MAG: transaldolase [Clostridiales bacterium]|jgi:transaldolase|nr:transaldolase [Clostridiales bacterium]
MRDDFKIKTFKTKIFSDCADLNGMKEMYKTGYVSGFTTNPTLMKKAGVTDYEQFARSAIQAIPDMPLSFEVFSDDFETMEREAGKIGGLGGNVFVKIPITNSKGESSLNLIKKLSAEGFKLNVTAVFTPRQAEAAVQALYPRVGAYVSVFAGRIADTGVDPMPIMKQTADLCHSVDNVKSLWASARELLNIFQAEECGVDIITVTNDILKKIPLIGKNLTQFSLETVRMFYNDAGSLGYKIV